MRRADALAALIVLCGAAGPLRAQEEARSAEMDGIAVIASTELPASQRSGWVPVRVRVENRRESAVQVQINAEQGYFDVLAASARARLAVGETREFHLLVPVRPEQTGSTGAIEISALADGERLGLALRLRGDASGDANETLHGVLVCGPRVRTEVATVHDSPLQVSDGTQSVELVRPWVREILAGALPTDWRAYSTLSLLVVDASETPSAAAGAALESWVRLGGLLIVRGEEAAAQAWLERHGLASALRENPAADADSAQGEVAWRRHGFGRIGIGRGAGGPTLAQAVQELTKLPRTPVQASGVRLPDGPFGVQVQALTTGIPGVRDVPRARLTLLLLAFAVIVGPVQFFRSRRRPERTWSMLVWTPLLSLGFVVLVLVVGLFAQGLGRKEAMSSLTWLAPGDRAAVALYAREVFVGNRFGIEPRLDAGTLLLPDQVDQLRDASERYVSLPEEAGRLEGAWAPSRSPVLLRGAWSGSLRAEIAFRRDGDAVLATSGFDLSLNDLHWRDAAGGLWRADGPLLPGATTRLEAVDADGWTPGCFRDDGPMLTDAGIFRHSVERTPPSHVPQDLPSGCWRARSLEAPWLPDCGISARSVRGEHWIFGEAEEQP